jgi:hypothetical protein
MYTQAHDRSSKREDLRAKKRAQISHAQSTRNEAQKTYWTGDAAHLKAGVTGGGGDGMRMRPNQSHPVGIAAKSSRNASKI